MPRDDYPPSSRKAIETYGNYVINGIIVKRHAISSMIHHAVNFLSLISSGKAPPYDKLFHLALVLDLRQPTGGEPASVQVDKDATVYVGITRERHEDDERIRVNTPSPPTTLRQFLDRGLAAIGPEAFFRYDVFYANCQHFVEALLQANGVNSPDVKQFVRQDTASILKQLPEWTHPVAKGISDVKEFVNVLTEGRGMVRRRRMRGGGDEEDDEAYFIEHGRMPWDTFRAYPTDRQPTAEELAQSGADIDDDDDEIPDEIIRDAAAAEAVSAPASAVVDWPSLANYMAPDTAWANKRQVADIQVNIFMRYIKRARRPDGTVIELGDMKREMIAFSSTIQPPEVAQQWLDLLNGPQWYNRLKRAIEWLMETYNVDGTVTKADGSIGYGIHKRKNVITKGRGMIRRRRMRGGGDEDMESLLKRFGNMTFNREEAKKEADEFFQANGRYPWDDSPEAEAAREARIGPPLSERDTPGVLESASKKLEEWEIKRHFPDTMANILMKYLKGVRMADGRAREITDMKEEARNFIQERLSRAKTDSDRHAYSTWIALLDGPQWYKKFKDSVERMMEKYRVTGEVIKPDGSTGYGMRGGAPAGKSLQDLIDAAEEPFNNLGRMIHIREILVSLSNDDMDVVRNIAVNEFPGGGGNNNLLNIFFNPAGSARMVAALRAHLQGGQGGSHHISAAHGGEPIRYRHLGRAYFT